MGRQNTGQARKTLAQKEKYKVGLGLCLAEFPKHGNLRCAILTGTGETHSEGARGVATEQMLGRKATQVPGWQAHTQRTWIGVKVREVRSKVGAPTLPQPHSLQAGSPQTSCFATHHKHPKPKTASRAVKTPNILK